MSLPPERHCTTARRFQQYLAELGDQVGSPERRAELEEEFRRALGTLVRHKYGTASALMHGPPGVELVHETLTCLLHDGITEEPGSLMRLVSSVAHRLFRSKLQRFLPIEHALTQPAAPPPPPTKLDLCSLPEDHRAFVRLLLDNDHLTHGSGRFQFKELAATIGLSRKQLRTRLRDLIREIGCGLEYQEFWLHRLAESCLEVQRVQTEEDLADVLGTQVQTRLRMRRVLERLSTFGIPQSFHPDLPRREARSRALRLLRPYTRKSTIPVDVLTEAADLLGGDRFAIDLALAERLRAEGDSRAALDRLEDWGRDALPPRRSLLLCLTRARCLERLGLYQEASNQLEACATRSRSDPLFQYNRYVLARLSKLHDRAEAALRDLRHCPYPSRMSPLLLRGIRLALDPKPQ